MKKESNAVSAAQVSKRPDDVSHLPVLTVPMNRADPFDERDATGWQLINLNTGRPDFSYNLYANDDRRVAFNHETGRPEDVSFQDPASRKPPQTHF